MGYCPSDCVTTTLTEFPVDICVLAIRKRAVQKLGFFECTTDIASPLTCEAYNALVAGGDLVYTNLLSNAVFEDPQFDSIQMADCKPADQFVSGRTLSVEDKIKVDVPAVGETAAIPYFDYLWWANKKSAQAKLRMGILWCDGTFEVMKDENGTPLEFTFTIFRAMNRENEGSATNAPLVLEMKKASFSFPSDPLQLSAPELDTTTCE